MKVYTCVKSCCLSKCPNSKTKQKNLPITFVWLFYFVLILTCKFVVVVVHFGLALSRPNYPLGGHWGTGHPSLPMSPWASLFSSSPGWVALRTILKVATVHFGKTHPCLPTWAVYKDRGSINLGRDDIPKRGNLKICTVFYKLSPTAIDTCGSSLLSGSMAKGQEPYQAIPYR